ncbi:MAG: TPM domain-containing protein [Rothia sp. (in: high G+C Gram-positive bacteria)]|uniref:TPM domain-containing protein n=1 Tax=Rothia sp. (in: high G+C Gram-positive bacteria) TaxID=1885016 RepID=UPI0027106C58|nr:TPM domain-containing protein [Rothia sp. (in: high G+C Gram-positive bacteria)]
MTHSLDARSTQPGRLSHRFLTLPALAAAGVLTFAPLTFASAQAAELPAAPASGNIRDDANLLTDTEEDSLNDLIDQKNRGTDRARFAIYTTNQSPTDLPAYATDLGNAWGVGDQGKDNGAVLVIDMEGRETFIAVADGAGDYISDSEAETIANDVLGPYLTDGNYAAGLEATIDEVYTAAETESADSNLVLWGVLGTLGTVAAIIVGWVFRDYRKVKRDAEDEMRRAKEENPGLSIPDDMRRDYIKYRYANRTAPVDPDQREAELAEQEAENKDTYTRYVPTFSTWLPLYATMPHLYSGSNHVPESSAGSGGSFSGGSSFGGGGGFSGGGGGGRF